MNVDGKGKDEIVGNELVGFHRSAVTNSLQTVLSKLGAHYR